MSGFDYDETMKLVEKVIALQKEIEELKSLINYIIPYVKENVGNEFMSNRLKEWLEKAEKIK